MSKYWILDQEDTPQRFPLSRLIDLVRTIACASDQFLLRRSEGYGAQVRAWNEMLDATDEIVVWADALATISRGNEEWFYDLDARCVTESGVVAFGVHDSTALFVEASPEIARRIVSEFQNVRAG
jgi:hypothetical protein